jgi:hypothetical protein
MVLGKPADKMWCKLFLLTVAVGYAYIAPNSAAAELHYFATLKPGTELPSTRSCAEWVGGSSWEPRPENYEANHPRRTGVRIDGASASFNAKFANRVNGSFTGTTDEILRWGACKWGFDEDITRARAIEESNWRQSQMGDKSYDAETCSLIGEDAPCWQSYGILQVKVTVHEGTYPLAKQSTAFNVDYALGWLRACYEGAFSHWLDGGYAAGDEWGCTGLWYSGKWYDDAATAYIAKVKAHLTKKPWKKPGF